MFSQRGWLKEGKPFGYALLYLQHALLMSPPLLAVVTSDGRQNSGDKTDPRWWETKWTGRQNGLSDGGWWANVYVMFSPPWKVKNRWKDKERSFLPWTTSNVPTVESSLRIHTVESSNGLPLTCVRSCPFSYGSCTFHGISLAGLVIHSFFSTFFWPFWTCSPFPFYSKVWWAISSMFPCS